jgi:hypothetical protein
MTIAGCGSRSELTAVACHPDVIECIRDATDPCAAPEIVSAECDDQGRPICPFGARRLERVAPEVDCRPLADSDPSIQSITGSLVPVPVEDGRCLWIAEEVITTEGGHVRNVAFDVDKTLPFGSCPRRAKLPIGIQSIVTEDHPSPTYDYRFTSAYRKDGKTEVFYRHVSKKLVDPEIYVTGRGAWDPASQRIRVPGGGLGYLTGDLGSAALVMGDYAYVWGCDQRDAITAGGCFVLRFRGEDFEYFTEAGTWAAAFTSENPSRSIDLFESGPNGAGVVLLGSDLLQVSTVKSVLAGNVARAPQGPWSKTPQLGVCDLVSDDSASICSGAAVHEELRDPTTRDVVLTYAVRTSAPVGSLKDPQRYWTRFVRVPAPLP